MTTQEALYALPEPIQEHLTQLVRLVIGMDAAEKHTSALLLVTVASFWTTHGREVDHIAAQLVESLACLLEAAHEQAQPLSTKESA